MFFIFDDERMFHSCSACHVLFLVGVLLITVSQLESESEIDRVFIQCRPLVRQIASIKTDRQLYEGELGEASTKD
jgi:hypothetical protein